MWQTAIELLFPPQCGACGKSGSGLCTQCVPRSAPLVRRLSTLTVHAVGLYEGHLRSAVIAIKSGRRDVACDAAKRLCELVPDGSLLTAVPTTALRRWERGFDGCVLMARECAGRREISFVSGLRVVRGGHQRGRSRGERLSAHGRFAWNGEPLDGMQVVLLDDVVTTGATLEDCARAVRAAGAAVTQAVALALTP